MSNFRGDRANWIASTKALLSLDAQDALVPHGLGGHARTLLEHALELVGPEEYYKPMHNFVVVTSFGLNMALATTKDLAKVRKELETETFLDCDNAIIRCSTVMAIMPAPAPSDQTKQVATEILQGMPTEGVKAQ